MIISGGVNIYPREVEDVLVVHPAVADVAVLGTPDPDMGEQVTAFVQLAPDAPSADDALAAELIALLPRSASHISSAHGPSASSTTCRACRPASSSSACFV